MAKAVWWNDRPNERYWLEITNRSDIGADLNAPQTDKGGKRPHHAYALITHVAAGDVVFHYDTKVEQIVGVSRVGGAPYASEVRWGSLADGTPPFPRAGWRVPLEYYSPINVPLDLARLREDKPVLKAIHGALRGGKRRSIHFPFEISAKRPLRPAQMYLAKLPRQVLEHYSSLLVAAEFVEDAPKENPTAPNDGLDEIGTSYRRADELAAVSKSEPFERDPALVERAHHGHAATQNELADAVSAHGLHPRSPQGLEPNYDLAWQTREAIFVVEVKSISDSNEEKQLRLGIGQILRYRQVLAKTGTPVIAVLATEKKPSDPDWLDLCKALDIELVWRGSIGHLFR
ncbi:MAG TPA: hypothetical protein VJ874_05415 [Candidatus Thermoplasmatota archaeon]|nr:hypothetical protein [Candidatus Thermoplasmatota archaeon]